VNKWCILNNIARMVQQNAVFHLLCTFD